MLIPLGHIAWNLNRLEISLVNLDDRESALSPDGGSINQSIPSHPDVNGIGPAGSDAKSINGQGKGKGRHYLMVTG